MTKQIAPANQPLSVWIDGSCKGNPGHGGHAWVAQFADGTAIEFLRHATYTTNNIEEMSALRAFLEWVHPDQIVRIYTDSQLIERGCNEWLEGWKAKDWRKSNGKPPENLGLWKEIDALLPMDKVTIHKVKGHSGVPGNERADVLANEAAGSAGLSGGLIREGA